MGERAVISPEQIHLSADELESFVSEITPGLVNAAFECLIRFEDALFELGL